MFWKVLDSYLAYNRMLKAENVDSSVSTEFLIKMAPQ